MERQNQYPKQQANLCDDCGRAISKASRRCRICAARARLDGTIHAPSLPTDPRVEAQRLTDNEIRFIRVFSRRLSVEYLAGAFHVAPGTIELVLGLNRSGHE